MKRSRRALAGNGISRVFEIARDEGRADRRAIRDEFALGQVSQASVVEWSAVTRLETLIDALKKFYGPLPMLPRDPFLLFVYEVMAVHSTPRKRDAALAALKRIPALTPDSMWRAPQKKLEESVKLAGPYTENRLDRKSTRLNSSHLGISYAVFCLKKKKTKSITSQKISERKHRNALT